jgi:hypothetical protein
MEVALDRSRREVQPLGDLLGGSARASRAIRDLPTPAGPVMNALEPRAPERKPRRRSSSSLLPTKGQSPPPVLSRNRHSFL